jgi:hypothetical protein
VASKKPDDSKRPASARSAPKQYGDHDGLCHFEWRGTRCPLPGNQSDSAGQFGAWWCLWHRFPENRKGGLVQDEHFRIFSDPDCVRDFIENNYSDALAARARVLIADNPQWCRAPGEDKSAYRVRVRALIGPLMGCVKRLETP